MHLTAALVLIIISLFLLLQRRHRPAFYFLTVSTLIFILVGTGIATQPVLNHLQGDLYVTQPVWKKRNAIVLLGAGTVRWPGQPDIVTLPFWGNSRILEAARLYFSCKKSGAVCKILTAGGDPKANGSSEAAVMSRSLKEIGVIDDDVILESKSRNTFENAQFSRDLLQQNGIEQTYLVTSGFHMQRAQLYFSYFLIDTLAAPADHLQAILSPIPISFNFVYFDIALHEYLGILQFHFYNFMGWNPKVAVVQ